MSNNEHNTVGPKVASRDVQPYAVWTILSHAGEDVGCIEANYQDANENSSERARRWVAAGYTVTWFDSDHEPYFSAGAHGTARKALAAARAYAIATTSLVRQKCPVT